MTSIDKIFHQRKNKNVKQAASKNDRLVVGGCSKGYTKRELLEELPRHTEYNLKLQAQIRRTPEAYFLNSGNQFARKILKMVREIFLDSYRAIQFTRTLMNEHGILSGVVALKHDTEDKVLEYFHERWPQCIICLYNERTKLTHIINEEGQISTHASNLKTVVLDLSAIRPRQPYFEDITETNEDMFKALYESQFIRERANRRYFKQMIPDQCMELPGMRGGVEHRFRNHSLDRFMKKRRK